MVLVSCLLVFYGAIALIEMRLCRMAASVTRPGVEFSYVYTPPTILANVGDRFGVEIPWASRPTHAAVTAHHLDREMFSKLLPLRLDGIVAEECTFDPADLKAYIDATLPVPRYGHLDLKDCSEVPAAMVKQIEKDHPQLALQQRGAAFADVLLINKPGGVEVKYPGSGFPDLRKGDRLLTLNGQPVQTYHEVKRAGKSLSSGESVELKVFGSDGFPRDLIYTAP